MSDKVHAVFKEIISLVRKAQELALSVGVPNVLQPGLVKEMIVAEILDHELIFSKRDADACDKNDPTIKYEYLSCYENGTGQLDRMFSSPKSKRVESLNRITRNKKIFLSVFYHNTLTDLPPVYVPMLS